MDEPAELRPRKMVIVGIDIPFMQIAELVFQVVVSLIVVGIVLGIVAGVIVAGLHR